MEGFDRKYVEYETNGDSKKQTSSSREDLLVLFGYSTTKFEPLARVNLTHLMLTTVHYPI